jgi:hypothetical protein
VADQHTSAQVTDGGGLTPVSMIKHPEVVVWPVGAKQIEYVLPSAPAGCGGRLR